MATTIQESGVGRRRLQRWLGIPAAAKPEIFRQILAGAEIRSLVYWLEIVFSAGIATFGLIQSSPAVIIGAMLISPLMGPIMATGLALAAGDPYTGIRAVLKLLASVTVAIGLSAGLVWLLPFHSATAEIVARTTPNLLDLGIALLCGLAGSIVVSRGAAGGATALPGVAIAVALMPPLCTVGFGVGSGLKLEIAGGAGLLFLTNLVAIVAMAFLVFLLVGVSAAEVHQAVSASQGEGADARVPPSGPLVRALATGGLLRWRVLMLLILLASIAVPLRRAFLRVAGETLAREAVQDELERLAPPSAILSQEVGVGGGEIAIHLISTRAIPDSELAAARQNLMRRTGRDVQLSVDAVASRSELAGLMERLVQPASVAAGAGSVGEMRRHLRDDVGQAIEQAWPSSDAPVQDFDIVLDSAGTAVAVRYRASVDLGDVPIHMILRTLRTTLAMPDLTLRAERIPPATAAPHPPLPPPPPAAPGG